MTTTRPHTYYVLGRRRLPPNSAVTSPFLVQLSASRADQLFLSLLPRGQRPLEHGESRELELPVPSGWRLWFLGHELRPRKPANARSQLLLRGDRCLCRAGGRWRRQVRPSPDVSVSSTRHSSTISTRSSPSDLRAPGRSCTSTVLGRRAEKERLVEPVFEWARDVG